MELSAPPLRTILDLDPVTETVEISAAAPQMRALLSMAYSPLDLVTRTAEQGGILLDSGQRDQMLTKVGPQVAFVTMVLVKRLAAFRAGCSYSGPMLGAAAALTGGNPGSAVLWAHAIAAWHARTGQPATLRSLLVSRLDGCVPSKAGFLALWDGQKLTPEQYREARAASGKATDNWLDYRSAWTDECLLSGERLSAPSAPRRAADSG